MGKSFEIVMREGMEKGGDGSGARLRRSRDATAKLVREEIDNRLRVYVYRVHTCVL